LGYDAKEETQILYAFRRGSVENVRSLVEIGAIVNMRSDEGSSALFEAIIRLSENSESNSDEDVEKSLQIVKLLLDFHLRSGHFDVNIRNPSYLD